MATRELAVQKNKIEELDKDMSELVNKIKEVHDDKAEKSKIAKEKSAAWDNIEKQKNEITGKYDKIRKLDESLHAELVETNKRRKANISSLKTVKFILLFLYRELR